MKTRHSLTTLILLSLIAVFLSSCEEKASVEVSGDLLAWHKITLTITGPWAGEYETLNPFTDFCLNAEFTNGSSTFVIPGYFAADGNAAETSARQGSIWRVHFCPPAAGEWKYRINFVKGSNVAILDNPGAAEKCAPDGLEGTITVGETDKAAPDFRAKGRLVYNGTHYLRHAGTGEVFLKGGADSPENFLGYKEFDGTYYGGNKKERTGEAVPNSGLHLYEPHIGDWKEGDPQWQNGKGKGIIGALNYLSSKGMNSVYFLTLNILGDGEDVWPYTDRNERYRFDCSKLDQWEIVFSHADKLGIMLHFVLQETENECLLDCGYLDVQRKLYLRELVARFSHHLAITWNMGEEHHPANFSPYGQTYQDTKKMADYLRSIDPYDNFIAIHTHSSTEQREKDLSAYPGFKNIEGPSIQVGNINHVHDDAIKWIKVSEDAGHPWVVCLDEIGPANKGAMPDSFDPAHDTIRHKVLYGNLMAGGAGVEWYFGYRYPHNDLNCEDWRSRENLWDQTRYALELFHKHLPFTDMKNADDLTRDTDDFCLAKEGEVYAIYTPKGKTPEIKLPEGNYSVSWYNPRKGGELLPGNPVNIAGGGIRNAGPAPEQDGKDWVCILKKEGV